MIISVAFWELNTNGLKWIHILHSMSAFRYQLIISIYIRDKPTLPIIIVAYLYLFESWVIADNNWVIYDIQCMPLCITWWLLSIRMTNNYFQQLWYQICCFWKVQLSQFTVKLYLPYNVTSLYQPIIIPTRYIIRYW